MIARCVVGRIFIIIITIMMIIIVVFDITNAPGMSPVIVVVIIVYANIDIKISTSINYGIS